jgi:hypothetical protein
MKDRDREVRKENPQPLKSWLTEWATSHSMQRSDVKKMYYATIRAKYRAERE